jgi:hypothetical protein
MNGRFFGLELLKKAQLLCNSLLLLESKCTKECVGMSQLGGLRSL